MNKADCLKYSLIKVFRNMKNSYLVVIFSICTIMLLITTTYKDIKLNTLDNLIKSDLGFRTIVVSANAEEYIKHSDDQNYDYGFNKILDNEHVLEIYNMNYYSYAIKSPTFEKDNYNGIIELIYGSKMTLPKVLLGKTISEEDTGVAICPLNFYPSINYETKNYDKFIDGRKLLNSTFEVESKISSSENKKYSKKFKIVGLYDANASNNYAYDCYVSANDKKEMYDTLIGNTNQNSFNSYLAIVDAQKNVNEVFNKLIQMGFDASVQSTIDTKYVNQVNMISFASLFIIYLSLLVISFLYIKKRILNNLNEYGLMKALGYNDKEICSLNFMQLSIILLISELIGLLIFIVVGLYLKSVYSNYINYMGLTINNSLYLNFIITLLTIFLLPLLTSSIMTKLVIKQNSIKLMIGNNT